MGFLAAVAITAGLAACGNTQVIGAIPLTDVHADKLLTSTAPGEYESRTVSEKAGCKGGIATPTTVDKEFTSKAAVGTVKDFYTELATEGQWFHRQDSSTSMDQTLNYSKQSGENYWQLHVTLPDSADGDYDVRIEAFNPHAHC